MAKSILLLTCAVLLSAAAAEGDDSSSVTDFGHHKGSIDWWNADDAMKYDEQEYFKDIPDLINMTTIEFSFNLTRNFISGFERGVFNNDQIVVNRHCFGKYYVQKLNEYVYLFEENPFENIWDNIFPEISLTW